MAARDEILMLNDDVVFRGRPARVAGRVQLEGSTGQLTFRYVLSDPSGAPVFLEEGAGRYALLRALPHAAQLRAVKGTVTIGAETYTLVGVRKLRVLEGIGNVAGVAPKAGLIVSGMFEGPMGTLMRELVPGTTTQVYYLLKPLEQGEIVSAAAYAAGKDAAAQAAGARALDGD